MRSPLPRRCSLLKCGLFVLVAWQAALPCVHAHETGECADGTGSHCFVEPLESPGDGHDHPPSSMWCWHFHCGLPGSGGDSSDAPGQCRHYLVAADGLTASIDVIRGNLLLVINPVKSFEQAMPVRDPAARPDVSRTVSGFFSTFATDMAYPVRFGNIRC